MPNYPIPKPTEPIFENGAISRQWYNFWRSLLTYNNEAELQAQIDAIQQEIENITGLTFAVIGQNSVFVAGSPSAGAVTISLLGDVSEPGQTYYYGTDTTGEKGWYPVSDTIEAVSGELTKSVTDGVTTLGLEDVPDSGTGTLQQTEFDAKGRKTGTASATTDNLPEGSSNLYFTASRVRGTVLTGLNTALTGPVVDTDTVLQAFGKLAGQQYTYDDLKASLVAGANITLTPDDMAETITITGTGGGSGGGVSTVTGGTGISVDNTDPDNPVVALSSGSIASLALADTAVQPGVITGAGLTMATARLLGRTTASAGAVEEITVGSGLSLSAGTLTATGGSGTVTSVGITGSTGLTVGGTNPVTGSGTITLTLSANLQDWSGIAIPADTTLFLRGDGTFSNTLTGAFTAGGTVTSNARFNSSTSNLLLQGGGGSIFLRPTAESTSGQVSIDVSGNVVAAGSVSSGGTISSGNGNLISATGSVVVAPTGAGMVYLRPNGAGSSTGQTTVSSGGVLASSGTVSAGNGNLISATGSVVVAPTGAGTVFLRPNGAGSATGQVTVDSAGSVVMSGTGSEFSRAAANSTTTTRQPRIFVGGSDPGAAAANGDIWIP